MPTIELMELFQDDLVAQQRWSVSLLLLLLLLL